MTSRRKFIRSAGVMTMGLAMPNVPVFARGRDERESMRPKMQDRRFTSEAVEETIVRMRSNLSNKELGWLFENCFPDTLDTTVDFGIRDGRPDTYVITGDIDAMWLRDSSAQVWPYLPLIKRDKKLQQLIAGVINRQTRCILLEIGRASCWGRV